MLDILFDIAKRDVVLQNGDFVKTTSPSAQNGSLILTSRCAYVASPLLGIGILDLLNSNGSKVIYEMNRWKQQVKDDGGRATWSTDNKTGIPFIAEVNYE